MLIIGSFVHEFPPRSALAMIALLAGLVAGSASHAQAPTPAADPAPTSVEKLDQMTVAADRYKPMGGPIAMPFLLGRLSPFEWPFKGETIVTGAHLPQAPALLTSAGTLVEETELRTRIGATPDWALRSMPDFGLNRGAALVGEPGRSLPAWRSLGAGEATTALLIQDGLPLKHPFTGAFTWAKVAGESLGRLELIPGSGGPAWGNGALSGALQFFAAPLYTELIVIDQPPAPISFAGMGSVRLSLAGGDFGTRIGEVVATLPVGQDVLQVTTRLFGTDGFIPVAPKNRGPIDVAAWSRHRWLNVRWLHAFSDKLALVATARGFAESRGLGTAGQTLAESERLGAVTFIGRPTNRLTWQATGFAQSNDSTRHSSLANPTRTTESPLAHVFATPVTTVGAMALGNWNSGGGITSAGIDLRSVRGEARENFGAPGLALTRRALAGGEQSTQGVFLSHDRALGRNTRTTVGARIDRWRDANGHIRENDLASTASGRDDSFPNRSGTAVSASGGVAWLAPSKTWRVRANGQRSFRQPTLSERYQRVYVTETVLLPDATLRTEHATSGEVALEWRHYEPMAPRPANLQPNARYQPPVPRRLLTMTSTLFWNEVRDAIVTGETSLATPDLRQRFNLDRTAGRGLELAARWAPTTLLTIDGTYAIQESGLRPPPSRFSLARKQAPHLPQRYGLIGAHWTGLKGWSLRCQLRWIGREFADAENRRPLAEAVTIDFGVTRVLSKGREGFLQVENLADLRVEIDHTGSGSTYHGSPRWFMAGVRGKW